MLDDPRHAEHEARRWLDLVRYAETKAHEYDFPIPNAWQYRDYVIRAFDADVPYDRFVMEQVAGDLLGSAEEGPRLDPTHTFDESVLGTGWWFLYEDVHSPVDTRADECDRVANQVDTLGKAVLGVTVACARCHEHKFDAISAEDFHAMAGFALSTAYSQVRFETRDVERRVASDLAALRDVGRAERRAAVAAFLDGERAASRALEEDARALLDAEEGADRLGTTYDELPEAAWLDVVLEDFESGDLTTADGPLAPWTARGDAFAPGAVTREDCPAWHDVRAFRGTHFLNSHAGHDSRDAAAGDAPKGTLTSSPFTLRRRYLHLLVSGGDHDATQVRVEVRRDGEWQVVARTSGRRSNTYAPRTLDLGEYLGARARIVAVDEQEGGWGHVGLDHIVASDDPSPDALDRALTPGRWGLRLALAERLAGAEGALELARAATRLAGATRSDGTTELEDPGDAPARVVVDYGAGSPLIQNGSAFAVVEAGDPYLEPGDDGAVRVREVACAAAEPGFGVLRTDGERHGGALDWVQAGRTLVTPTFELEGGVLWYLVRGRAKVYAALDSHRMVSGPLYLEALNSFDTGGEWRWVEHDLRKRDGAMVRVEFTATGDTLDLAVAQVVDLPPGVPPPPLPAACTRGDDALLRGAHRERRDAALLLGFASWRARESAILASLVAESAIAPAALELEGRDEHVLRRGDAHSPGAPAPRRDLAAVRATLHEDGDAFAHDGDGSGRLGLARSFARPDHPLVARVWTNRVWHHLFGRGIVSSVDDFGVMGAEPSHPELLDRLARDFTTDGWSTKRLVRRILLSDAYRRSSAATPEMRELDPENVLLARANVRRVEAEGVRDALLFVSSSLDETRFGPSVPVHLTPFMNGRGRPSESGPLDGEGRRSIYLSVRRNFVTPFLAVFDFPVPSACAGRRTVSNVPAQAL
ncbi:MAG: DUF1549 and DUF1553 domain-containing protein, partial [Planctomycetota bacterium]